MKMTVNSSMFHDTFIGSSYENNFSYEARELIFEYLEEVDPDTELDIVAIACEFSEDSIQSLVSSYDIDVDGLDEEEQKEAVKDYLQDNTTFLGFSTDDCAVFVNF